ncbi:MAG: PAS domain S-box protein [Methanoregula sp.]
MTTTRTAWKKKDLLIIPAVFLTTAVILIGFEMVEDWLDVTNILHDGVIHFGLILVICIAVALVAYGVLVRMGSLTRERDRMEEDRVESARRLRYLVTSSPVTLYTCRASGNYAATFVSDNITENLGYVPSDFTGDPDFWQRNVHPDDASFVAEGMSHLTEKDQVVLEYRFRHKNGTWRWIQDTLRLIRNKDKTPREIIGSWSDVTDRKQAEEQLKAEEEKFRLLIMNSIDIITVLSPEGILLYNSPSLTKILGYRSEELDGKDLMEILHPDDRVMVRESITFAHGHPGSLVSPVFRIRHRNGSWRWVQSGAISAAMPGYGQVIIANSGDITEQKKAEDALRENEDRLKKLLDHLPAGVLVIDAADHTIIKANRKAVVLIGAPEYEITGKVCHQFVCPAEAGKCPISDFGQTVDNSERVLLTAAGGRIPIIKTVIEEVSGGRPVLIETFFDITDRKQVERALRESELRYRTIFESSRDAIMTLEPPLWKFTSGNPATVQMFMAQDEAEFTSHGPGDFSPEFQPDGRESWEKAMEMIESAMQDGTRFFEWTHKRLNGKDFPATVLLSRIELAGKTFLQATVRDITKSKLAKEAIRESEKKFHAVFDAARDGILIADPETHRFVMANAAITKLTGYSEEELLSLSIPDIHRPADLPYVIGEFERQSRGEIDLSSDIPVLRKDGTIFYADINSSPFFLNDKKYILGSFRDVTERNAREKKLTRLQKEKEILLRELHHRVGNILQMAVSMMRTGIRRESNGQVRSVLLDTQIRLNAIAATFEKIYYSEDISRVNLQNVITAIVSFLKSTCGNTVQYVDIDIRINIRELGVDLALPLALITSELISNSLRHAFPDGRSGTISLTISEKNDGYILLSMSDDGRGLPAGINPADSDTIGFGLVRILADQVGGRLDYSSGQSGLTVTLAMPRKAESDKSGENN